jgi:hypothetical protein
MNTLFDNNNFNSNHIRNVYNFQDILLEQKDLPIYIIQAHGVYDIKIKDDKENNIVLDNDKIKNTIELNDNMYIIDTSPINSMQISHKNDIVNIKKIINNPERFKTEIFSNKFNDTFRYISNINNYNSELLVGPPRYSFPNKLLYFDDVSKKYNFDMGIFEVCEETKNLKIEINQGYNNKSLPDKLHRIWNYHINNEKLFNYENKDKGIKIKKLIENSIINNYCIELRQIVEILEKGIIILFTCSDMNIFYNNKEITLYKKRCKNESKKEIAKYNYLYKKGYESLLYFTEKLKDNWYEMVQGINLPQKTRKNKEIPYLLRNRIVIKYRNKKLVSKYNYKM